MSDTSSSSRDARILLGGIAMLFIIGSWWLYKNTNHTPLENAASVNETPQRNFATIGTDDLKLKILSGTTKSQQQKTVVLDARPGSLWNEEHIIGSKSLTPEDAKNSFDPKPEDKETNWIVLGDTIERAQMLSDILVDRGIPENQIHLYDSTFSVWKEKTSLVVTLGDPAAPTDASKVKLLEPTVAKTALESGSWQIVDVRSREDFASGHIPRAMNIPFFDIEERRNEFSSLSRVFVYGSTGLESFRAGTLLFDLGIFSVSTLSGSFDDWKKANLPVEK